MNKIFEINEKIGENVSNRFKGNFGIVIHGSVLFCIFAIIGMLIYWTINVFLVSLLWLIPVVIFILIGFLINYFIKRSIHWYK